MIVQIYELDDPQDAIRIAALGVDHIGVLVGNGQFPREIMPSRASIIFEAVPKSVKRVALSLSADLNTIVNIVEEVRPDIIHIGAAIDLFSLQQMRELRRSISSVAIMRSIPVVGIESIDLARQFSQVSDFLLLDSHRPGDAQIGAQGRIHDWSISKRIKDSVAIPIILAGGLGPDNVVQAINAVSPFGVNLKTRTDREDGRGKDIEKVRQFVTAAKNRIF